MNKTTSAAWVLAALLALTVGANSQDQPRAKADWRTIGFSAEFLANHLVGDSTDAYDLTASAMLADFARRAEVRVRFDTRTVAAIPKLSLRGVKEATKLSAFELCQRALDAGGLTLFPEAGAERAFVVDAVYNAAEQAPLVTREALSSMAPSEWGTLTYSVRGPSPSQLVSLCQPLVSQSGGRVIYTSGQSTLLIVERAANLLRVLEVVDKIDTPREDPKTVPYQRASQAHLFELAKTLQAFLDRYAEQINVAAGRFHLKWEHESRVMVGIVPQALCSFLDAAIDAADKNAQQAKAEREQAGPNYTCFELIVPPEKKVAAIETGLRSLFEQEMIAGDLRVYVKGEQTKVLVVRCRKWLENGVRDAFETLLK